MRWFLPFLALLLPLQAEAADFRLGGDKSLNCVMSVDGPILPGDAKRFRAALVELVDDLATGKEGEAMITRLGWLEPGLLRICLNSPGGALTEAIEMADTLAFSYKVDSEIIPAVSTPHSDAASIISALGTAVPAGARCESACAVLFMAGGYFSNIAPTDNVREIDRVLHIEGKLGFHAPSLDIASGSYTEETVNEAYAVAVETTRKLTDRLMRYRFPASLFNRMVATPARDMFYINNVEEAASWSIRLAGVPLIDRPSRANLIRLCRNIAVLDGTTLSQEEQYSKAGIPADIRAESRSWWYHEPDLAYWVEDPESQRISPEETVIVDTVNTWSGSCDIEYDTATGATVFASAPPRQQAVTPSPGNYGWAMYPGYTTLEELVDIAGKARDGRIGADTLLPVIWDRLAGHCAQYDGSNRLVSKGKCEGYLLRQVAADSLTAVDFFLTTWLDGAEVPVRSGTGAEIGAYHEDWEYIGQLSSQFLFDENGAFNPPARLDPADLTPATWDIGCSRSRSGDGVRCFLHRDVLESSVSRWRR